MRGYGWGILVGVIAIGGAAYYFHHNSEDSQAQSGKHGKGAGAVPVNVAAARTGDIDVYLSGLGSITPRSTVTVNTRVNGELMRVDFREGQMVKKDQMLAKIDPRPYQAALEQAKGQLMRDQALLREAKIDLDRYQILYKQDSIAKQQLDTQVSLVAQYEGAVENDKGLVDSAQVNLIYTDITSPVAGRVGLRLVDPGNIVNTTATSGIVVVTELQPITAIFTLPEDNIPEVMRHYEAGILQADAFDRAGKTKIADGQLYAIDNQIDPNTGMVKLRAEFPNKDNTLFPSQFVNIRLLLDTKRNVLLIPTAGVQRGQQGTFVYLVKDASQIKDQKPTGEKDNDNKTKEEKPKDDKGKDGNAAKEGKVVVVTPVTLGTSEGENVEIVKGLKAGDQVVIDGGDALHDGSAVEVAAPKGKEKPAAPDKTTEKPHHQHKKQQSE